MDPELLRAHRSFLKKAAALPTVEKKPAPVSGAASSLPGDKRTSGSDFDKLRAAAKKSRPAAASAGSARPSTSSDGLDPLGYKTMQGSSQFKYAVLYKILQYMKKRHLEGDTHPLSVEEILDETKQLDVGVSTKHWLGSEALRDNPRIQVLPPGDRFVYRPPYPVKDKKSLLMLLDRKDQKGEGGVFLEEIEDSLPDCDRCIKGLGDRILQVVRPQDKKVVLFYNDKSCHLDVDEEFRQLWRSVTVDSFDNQKIEETLHKSGISFLKDQGPKKISHSQKRKAVKKKPVRMQHNEHIASVLKDYPT